MTASEIASAERDLRYSLYLTDDVKAYVEYLKKTNEEAVGAVAEIARHRANIMVQPFEFHFMSDYDIRDFRTIQQLEMRPKQIAYRFIHEHPMDKSPAFVVDHVIDQLKNGIAEQFARLLIRNWSETQRYA